jgi:hypothetical protein
MGNLRVNIGSHDFVATFQHCTNHMTYPKDDPLGTTCIILRGPKGIHPKEMKEVAKAESFLSLTDQFNKNIGRKISLTRAIAALGIPKQQRALFWIAYYKMRNNKW